MKEIGADFIITGEVLGQRPKSQMLHALKTIEKTAELEGKIIRPLSAQLLSPTEMEIKGIIDRTKLLGIQGLLQVEPGWGRLRGVQLSWCHERLASPWSGYPGILER